VRPWLLRLQPALLAAEARGPPLKRWRDHRDGPQKGWVPRHELPPKLIDRLKPMPESLEQEMQTSLQWCRRVAQPGRPHSAKKRATTCQAVDEALTRMAGFAVHDQQLPEELLTVRDLYDPALVHAFIQWWVEERRRKLTPGLCNMVVNLEVTARHWLKELTYAETLKALLKGDLPVADAAQRCPRSTPRASMTFGRPGPSSTSWRTRQPHEGELLVAWADRSDAGADVLAPEVDWAFASADALPLFAKGTAAQRSIVWHAATRGPLAVGRPGRINACAITSLPVV
jgi:hypothetical protein